MAHWEINKPESEPQWETNEPEFERHTYTVPQYCVRTRLRRAMQWPECETGAEADQRTFGLRREDERYKDAVVIVDDDKNSTAHEPGLIPDSTVDLCALISIPGARSDRSIGALMTSDGLPSQSAKYPSLDESEASHRSRHLIGAACRGKPYAVRYYALRRMDHRSAVHTTHWQH